MHYFRVEAENVWADNSRLEEGLVLRVRVKNDLIVAEHLASNDPNLTFHAKEILSITILALKLKMDVLCYNLVRLFEEEMFQPKNKI